jgi:gluconolactonase
MLFFRMNAACDLRCLAQGIAGAEGPLVTRSGEIFLVAPSDGEVVRVLPGGGTEVFASTGGRPAGLQLDREGNIWVADMSRGILRVAPDGSLFEEATTFEDAPMRGCNDLIFDGDGNLYFTAPAGSNGRPGGATGEIFFRSRDGQVSRIDAGFAFPNGIAVNAACNLLVFAETFTHRLIAYDLAAPGQVRNRREWAMLPCREGEKAGGDGMDFDANGNLVVTNYSAGTLEVFSPSAEHLQTITLPFKKCSNVHFYSNVSPRLLVTEHENNALWDFDYGCPGQTQFGWT